MSSHYFDFNDVYAVKGKKKSPAKMQKHLENLPPLSFEEQIIKASEWVKDSLLYDEKILCIGHEIPAKLQDGPQCGIVSLWMAGQHLDPDSEIEVQDIQDQALDLHFTKHGEMFSATNMAKLAEKVYHCEAQRIKGSWEVLTKLPKTLDLICVQEKLILVPYDSDADQWPALRKGQKAHWGVIFGVALMMPFKTKIFDDAKHLDSFVSYLKPPLSSSQVDMILEQLKEIRYLLMVRQSKSKRIFLFNSRLLAESNNNLTGYSNNLRQAEMFLSSGQFVMPPGGVKSGLKGQLVYLSKKPTLEDDDATDDKEELLASSEDDKSI